MLCFPRSFTNFSPTEIPLRHVSPAGGREGIGIDEETEVKNQLSACVLAVQVRVIPRSVECQDCTAYRLRPGSGVPLKAMTKLGLRIQELDGVFVTHIHGDHVNESTVRNLIKLCIPIYCPPEIEHHLRKKYKSIAGAFDEKLLIVIKKSESSWRRFLFAPLKCPTIRPAVCFGYNIFCDAEPGRRR